MLFGIEGIRTISGAKVNSWEVELLDTWTTAALIRYYLHPEHTLAWQEGKSRVGSGP
jgi:hypothetical protein